MKNFAPLHLIRFVRAILKSTVGSEIEEIVLKLLGMSVKDVDVERRIKSTKASAFENLMQIKGPELIRMLKKMVKYEYLHEVKKKSGMVSHVISS